MSSADPTPWLHRLLWAAAAAVLGMVFFVPVTGVLDASLDASNYASYTSFTAQGLQYGPEVAPMAGPLGFVVYGWVYNGELYWHRFALELLTKLTFAGLVLWFFWRARGSVVRWLWLAANLLVVPATGELSYDLSILYATLFLLLGQPRPFATIGLSAFLAVLALCKGTHLILTFAVIGLLGAEAAWRHDWRKLVRIVGTYALVLMLLWLAAGQRLLNFPAFVRNILELSSGYSSGMALQEEALTFGVGAALFLTLLVGIALLFFSNRRLPSLVIASLLLGGFAFAQWKHGFVRADGHVYLFFNYTLIAGLTALLVERVAGLPSPLFRSRAAFCAVGVLLALYATGSDNLQRWRNQASALPELIVTNVTQLFHPAATERRLAAELHRSQTRFALPEVTEHVGHAPIDFFGYQGGFLPLNQLYHQPHPVAGGGPFSVFTPALQRLNAGFVLSPDRPEYYLLKLQTIDGRWVAQDDAGSLNAILHLYRPVMGERDMVLLRADTAATPLPPIRKLSHHTLRAGQTISIPTVAANEVVLASFDLPLSFAGRVRVALYKSPIVALRAKTAGGDEITRRIIPSMAAQPFIISPLLDTTADLLSLYRAGAGTGIEQLRFEAEPGWGLAAAECSVTFYAQPRPAPLEAGLLLALTEQIEYPIANRAPSLIEAPNARQTEIDGRMVQQLEPPGKIVFDLRGDERELLFDYGFDPESYTRGTTDGADFVVELVTPGTPPEFLFQSRRAPKTVSADRGRHHAQLWLPILKPNTQLVLRTGGGIRGATDWDWTFFDNIRIHHGRYRVEQFPGFAVAPIEAEGNGPRMTKHENRDVLLLNSPGKLVFALKGTEQRLRFVAGLMPGSYLEGQTDGVDFIVEVQPPGENVRTIFHRWLQPRTVEADRGIQPLDIPLPALPRGTRLSLRADAGPHGDMSWDWSFVGSVRLE